VVDRLIDERFRRFTAQLGTTRAHLVTTVGHDGERAGCLVGFVTECSMHPPRVLVGLSVENHTHEVAASADLLAVHLIPRAALPLVSLFAQHTGDEIDKFERCSWTAGPGEVPLLDECPAWFVGRVLHRVPELGDHTGYVIAPVAVSTSVPDGPWLTVDDVSGMKAAHPQ
jgi:flavin reductase (DIM6/NTAB) family NADH-FMN oxidoreductase RutF